MYRRPGAHKAKAAPARWLARYARGRTGEEASGARGWLERENARRRARAAAEGERDETRDTYSPPRSSVHACLPARLPVSSRDIRVPLFECARGLYRLTTDKDFRLLEPVARKFPRGDRREPDVASTRLRALVSSTSSNFKSSLGLHF